MSTRHEDSTSESFIARGGRAPTHAQLRALIEQASDGIFVADRDGRYTFVNQAGCRMLGYSREQIIGKTIFDLIPAEDVERLLDSKAQMLNGATHIAEWQLRRADGSWLPVEVSGKILTDGQWQGIVRDISERKAQQARSEALLASLQCTQEQLRAAVSDRENILAIVTHDLRNPLTAMMMSADAMAWQTRTLAEDSPLHTAIADVRNTARRMSGLVDDLLAIGAAQGGRSMLKLTARTASSLIEQAAQAARPQFAARSLRLELEIAPDLPIVNVDGDRVVRVLTNLLDNALKFTAPGGRIFLSADAVASGVRFTVANSGEAVPTEDLEAMFQPFWQAACHDHRGAGLGLAICRSIVEAHGGTIWAEPAQGERMRVCFVLPLAQTVTT